MRVYVVDEDQAPQMVIDTGDLVVQISVNTVEEALRLYDAAAEYLSVVCEYHGVDGRTTEDCGG